MAKPTKPQQQKEVIEDARPQGIQIMNIAGAMPHPDAIKDAVERAMNPKEAPAQPQTPPDPEQYVACVCMDPYGRVVILHKEGEDAQLDFPKGVIRKDQTKEDAANDVMRAHAGISAPTWEEFAYDAGTRTTYLRAHTRGVYDVVHNCPDAEGTVHVITLENITDITQSKHEHVIWMTTLAVYGPLMSSLSFRCPVN